MEKIKDDYLLSFSTSLNVKSPFEIVVLAGTRTVEFRNTFLSCDNLNVFSYKVPLL